MELSIIIVEFHGMTEVDNCLASIDRWLRDISHETVVVSNSTYTEEQLSAFRKALGQTRLVSTGDNLGYAGAVNVGLKHTSGEFIYLLNPDVLLQDDRVRDILDDMRKDQKWAMAGPKVLDGNGLIQPSCRRFPRPWTVLMTRTVLRHLPGGDAEYSRYFMIDMTKKMRVEVDWVSGGAIIAKRAALNVIGGMDDRYFLYMEDVDWCRSVWEAGFRVMYCPESSVVHAGRHQSIRLQFSSLRHIYWHLVSLAKYFLKYRFE